MDGYVNTNKNLYSLILDSGNHFYRMGLDRKRGSLVAASPRTGKRKTRAPQQKRSIDKKEKIVVAAYAVFCSKGFYKTTTVDIARAAGVNIALGTDASVSIECGENGLELLELAREGLSPVEVLCAATCSAARALGLAGETGSLEEGKAADLLVLESDPFGNLDALAGKESILAVIARGRPCRVSGKGRDWLGSLLAG